MKWEVLGVVDHPEMGFEEVGRISTVESAYGSNPGRPDSAKSVGKAEATTQRKNAETLGWPKVRLADPRRSWTT